MIRMIFLLFLILSSLLEREAISASIYSNLHPSIISGVAYTRMGNEQNVWLARTPEPGLQNTFTSSGKQYGTVLYGLALEETLPIDMHGFKSDLGIELDYLRNFSLSGTVHPMVNVAPDFDVLDYSYKMRLYTLFATAKLTKQNLVSLLGLPLSFYLQGGIGGSRNELYDYIETSPDGSSAAPMLMPFRDGTNTSFSYFIGTGISFHINKSFQLLIGYRYLNSGTAKFKPSPVQQTNDTLDFSLSHHLLMFSLVI